VNGEIANLPKGWVRTNLSAIAEVIRGVSFPKDQKSSLPQEGFLGCLRTTNVQREVEWDDILFVPKRFIRKPEQLVRLDDILISTANSLELVGKVALIRAVPFVTTIGAFIAIIRVHPDMDPKFVYFQITSSDIQSYFRQTASTTTNISNISTSNVLNSLLRIPPLPEQHRIVAKIEELFTRLDAGVVALKKIKAQLKRYRQSVLKHAFEGKLTQEWRQAHQHELEPASTLLDRIKQERHKTAEAKNKELPPLDTSDLPELPKGWMWSNFEELKKAEKNAIKAGPFGSSLKKESYVPHGYKIYGQEQVIRQNPSYGNYYIGEEKYVELKSCAVKPGDILISLVGTIGRVLILPEHSEAGIINPRLIKLSLEERLVDNKYIKAYIESSAVRDFFTLASHGETMEILNLGILRTLPIPVPSPTEQHKIVEEIERRFSIADQIEKTVDQGLEQAERLRQSILKRAFEGKLVPQDPNDEPAEKLLERVKEERAKRLAEDHSRKKNKTRVTTKQMRLV
jgi:type I restriction enzyme S subunit